MEQRIKSCRSSKIMFRERGDLLAVLLLLLLVLAGTGLAKQDEHRKNRHKSFDLTSVLKNIMGKSWLRQRPRDLHVINSFKGKNWMRVFREASTWTMDHCRCAMGQSKWNGTTSSWKRFLARAHPEAAYFRALLSASIVFHTARHCALGKIPCYTANKTVMAMLNGETSIPFFGNITKKTSFCKFHFDEGVRVAKVLDIVDNFTFASLRSRRRISKKHDLIAHYHNNAVGRQVITTLQPEMRCFCSGPSGSCVLRTCSYIETFHLVEKVGVILYKQYKRMLQDPASIKEVRQHFKKIPEYDHIVQERYPRLAASRSSPNYCRRNKRQGILGQFHRSCVAYPCGNSQGVNFEGTEQCAEVCCGEFESRESRYSCNCKSHHPVGFLDCAICYRKDTVCSAV